MLCGCFLGFGGCMKHTNLTTRYIARDNYLVGHMLHRKYLIIIDGNLDKIKKLTINTSYVRSGEDTRLKLPILSHDPDANCPGACVFVC